MLPYGKLSLQILELERKLGDQRSKSEAEMAALVLAHNENIAHLREQYEAKISEAGLSCDGVSLAQNCLLLSRKK